MLDFAGAGFAVDNSYRPVITGTDRVYSTLVVWGMLLKDLTGQRLAQGCDEERALYQPKKHKGRNKHSRGEACPKAA